MNDKKVIAFAFFLVSSNCEYISQTNFSIRWCRSLTDRIFDGSGTHLFWALFWNAASNMFCTRNHSPSFLRLFLYLRISIKKKSCSFSKIYCHFKWNLHFNDHGICYPQFPGTDKIGRYLFYSRGAGSRMGHRTGMAGGGGICCEIILKSEFYL